jgi:hypothetical protein
MSMTDKQVSNMDLLERLKSIQNGSIEPPQMNGSIEPSQMNGNQNYASSPPNLTNDIELLDQNNGVSNGLEGLNNLFSANNDHNMTLEPVQQEEHTYAPAPILGNGDIQDISQISTPEFVNNGATPVNYSDAPSRQVNDEEETIDTTNYSKPNDAAINQQILAQDQYAPNTSSNPSQPEQIEVYDPKVYRVIQKRENLNDEKIKCDICLDGKSYAEDGIVVCEMCY